MMRYKTIGFFMLYWVFLAHGQKAVPAYRDVVTRFYSSYDLSGLDYPRVEFEKRSDGWYFKTLSLNGNQTIYSSPHLYYSIATGEYVSPNYPPGHEQVDISEIVTPYDEHQFSFQPMYGYQGWYNDVIKKYSLHSPLTDSQLYAVSRAYTAGALAPLTNPNRDSDPAEKVKLYFRPEPLSTAELRRFEQRMDSGIAAIKQLSDRNPSFVTSLGSARYKYGNEVMTKFHCLLEFTSTKWKSTRLPDDLFDDSVLARNRQYLDQTPPGAILLTFGDTDFYPLLYLQHHARLRPDVHIINYNLIGIDYFIYKLKYQHFESAPLSIQVDTSVYAGDRNSYFRLTASQDTVTLDGVLEKLADVGADERVQIAAGQIALKNLFAVSNNYVGLDITGKSYLLKNQWILLHIIDQLTHRPLIATQRFEDELQPLNDYFIQHGSVYVFKP